jgi:hypothetical protein
MVVEKDDNRWVCPVRRARGANRPVVIKLDAIRQLTSTLSDRAARKTAKQMMMEVETGFRTLWR